MLRSLLTKGAQVLTHRTALEIAGLTCWTVAGWIAHPIAGLVVMGAAFLNFSIGRRSE